MIDRAHTQQKSIERIAFDHYLRTGRRLMLQPIANEIERKFNPYHDPQNGQFTFAPGGSRSLGHAIASRRRSGYHPKSPRSEKPNGVRAEGISASKNGSSTAIFSQAIFQPDTSSVALEPTQYSPNPRAVSGNNGGPPLNDPPTLVQLFPGIASSPGGSILAMADNLLDLTGPSTQLTASLTRDHVNMLIGQIQTINPGYRLDSFGFPETVEGQLNLINQLRVDRATAFYRFKGEIRPLQVETLRLMQDRADRAYDEGVALYNTGRLNVKLSREEAIGNYVDRAVRKSLRQMYSGQGIDSSKGQPVRVIGREYDTSGSDKTFRIPDARVGNIAFDVTLTRKTLATPQVRGFFASDFKPSSVIIIRPRQLGPNNSYAIIRPRNRL